MHSERLEMDSGLWVPALQSVFIGWPRRVCKPRRRACPAAPTADAGGRAGKGALVNLRRRSTLQRYYINLRLIQAAAAAGSGCGIGQPHLAALFSSILHLESLQITFNRFRRTRPWCIKHAAALLGLLASSLTCSVSRWFAT